MSGGSGQRLWPASRPHHPKPFIPLVGTRSTFDEALERTRALSEAAPVTVVAGRAHAPAIRRALRRAGGGGLLMIEPEARDSAPAMAAAAHWIAAKDAEGVILFLAADHHIPDTGAFAEAVGIAERHAREGWIVTLGVQPDSPSTAYGYIRPGQPQGGIHHVAAFVEKPDLATAAQFLRDGYLWNSGMFIARADVLIAELEQHAPAVSAAAREAVEQGEHLAHQVTLADVFRAAPKISIDYAVMEKTDRALVAPARFAWSDLGAWNAVLAASERDAGGNSAAGEVVLENVEGCLVRAGQGMTVVVVGGRNLAIIADREAVMVCDLDSAEGLKAAVERASRPRHGRAEVQDSRPAN
jgi:mannose-1-phosphate guanylyltransferase/mannose-6-phosphate isomerase